MAADLRDGVFAGLRPGDGVVAPRRPAPQLVRPSRPPTDDLAILDGTDDPAPVIATRAEVEGLLRSLTPQHRAALMLRFHVDLEHTEVAAELGIAPGTARSLVSRALHAARAGSTDQEARRER